MAAEWLIPHYRISEQRGVGWGQSVLERVEGYGVPQGSDSGLGIMDVQI